MCMTGLSLFTGIGGIDLAFEAAGGRVAAMCEQDKFCQDILRRHWPGVPIHEDIKTLRGEEIGAVDIIFGGFPCQGFSVAGKRKGKEDERYLWPHFARLVSEIKPAWVVGENVPGILQLAADDVCEDLERMGYFVRIFNYEAAAVGALHRRARIFFVGHSRRRMRERGTIDGAFCEKRAREQAYFVERSGGTSRSINPNTSERSEAAEDSRGCSKRRCTRTWDKFTNDCQVIPDSNGTRFQEQQSAISEERERTSLGTVERGSGRLIEPCVGGVADGLPCWLDRAWWQYEPDIPRVARGVPNRVQRLKALGNAVVPAQIYPIFKGIMEIWQADGGVSHD